MVSYRINDEEVALINAFRVLTTRQREMIMRGCIGAASEIKVHRLTLVVSNVLPFKRGKRRGK